MNLRNWILCVGLSFTIAGEASGQAQYAFRITFSDKTGSPSIANPLSFLSQRALDRRALHGVTVNPTDQPVSPDYMDSVLTITNGVRHVTSRWLNTGVILLTDSSKILLLQNKPYITDIKYVAYFGGGLHNEAPKFEEETRTPKPQYKTTGTPAYYGPSWDQTNMVKGECLHDLGFMGQGKLIAVLDDGFQYVNTNPGFDSLMSSGRLLDKYNFVRADTSVFAVHNHGTEVLSTMAGYVPNVYVGAAPKAEYALYVTEHQGPENPIEMDNMIAGMERADSLGADILTSSLGYDVFFGPVPYTIPDSEMTGNTTPVAIAANHAVSKGMLLVITAGNEGSSGLLTPGDADSVITVGSVNINKIPPGNSGHGPNADGQVKPDVCALGQPGSVLLSNLNAFSINGTSIATPQIAGFAACLWQAGASKTNFEVKRAILQSSHLFSAPGLPQLGYGIPDFCNAHKTLSVAETVPLYNSIKVYPNPFNSTLTLEIHARSPESVSIQLTDITGMLVYDQESLVTSGLNELNMNMPGELSVGVYLCRVVMAHQVHTIKVVKQ